MIREGTEVTWSWGGGRGTGKVVERFTQDVSRELKGAEVKRNASNDRPAFLIRQEDGDEVLKSISEIEKA